MTFRDISYALRRFWPLVFLVFALCFSIGLAASFLPAKKYQATATMFAEPASARTLDFGGQQALEFLLPSVLRAVETPSFNAGIRRRIRTPPSQRFKLTATDEPGTAIFTVIAESKSPQLSADAANTASQALINRKLSPLIRLSRIDPARPPGSFSSPRRVPIMLAAVVLGLIASLFAALAAGALRRRVPGADVVRSRFGLTVLGEIPQKRFPETTVELFQGGGFDLLVEDFQRLRANVELLARGQSVIAVTSWAGSEGKTTVAAGLAWTLASLGQPVVALDCDLRKPRLHELLEIDLHGGVANIREGAGPETYLRQTAQPHLSVIPAGVTKRHPTEVLNEALPRLAEAFEDRLMIIDTPPIFSAETTMIASMADSMIVVMDARRRDPEELDKLVEELRLTDTPILGVVLNRTRADRRRRASSYYYARS